MHSNFSSRASNPPVGAQSAGGTRDDSRQLLKGKQVSVAQSAASCRLAGASEKQGEHLSERNIKPSAHTSVSNRAKLLAGSALIMTAVPSAASCLFSSFVGPSASKHPQCVDESGAYKLSHHIQSCRPLSSDDTARVAFAVNQIVGSPATTNSANFATRADLNIAPNQMLHIDVGGEGQQTAHGIISGFDAININAKPNSSQYEDRMIPNLVLVNDWETSPPYPFADGSVDKITMQGAPLTDHNAKEMARVLAPGGVIDLWVCDDFADNINWLSKEIGAHIEVSEPSCHDEFEGMAGQIKCCLIKD